MNSPPCGLVRLRFDGPRFSHERLIGFVLRGRGLRRFGSGERFTLYLVRYVEDHELLPSEAYRKTRSAFRFHRYANDGRLA